MFVIKFRNFFFALSGILIVGSFVGLAIWGVRPSIDFVGGTIVDLDYTEVVSFDNFPPLMPSTEEIKTRLGDAGFKDDVLVKDAGNRKVTLRMKPLQEGDRDKILNALAIEGNQPQILRLSSIGPSIGQELRRKTSIAIVLVVLMIVLYIAFVFRKVSKPISSWMYGLVAIGTLIHDIAIPTGVFVLLGHFAGYEADTLFIVAILTILGLSVTDTIVVFDRIRENLAKEGDKAQKDFAGTVGRSLEQTYVRSFNTSFTVILVLLVLFFLGGPTIHTFVLTLLVGQIAGTYSSIFIASPLLVVIANHKLKAVKK